MLMDGMIYKKGLMYTDIPAVSAAKKGKLLSASPFIIHAFLFLKKYLSNNTKGGSTMKESYKSFDELPMMLSVSQVAKVLGISRTRSYELVNEKGFPKIKIGTRIVVPKDEFMLWIQKEIKKG